MESIKYFKSSVCALTGEKNYYFGLHVKEVEELDEWTVFVQLLNEWGSPLSLDGFKSHLLEQFPDEAWGEQEMIDMFQGGVVESLKEELEG